MKTSQDGITVELLAYTPGALDLLLETKNTRLSNESDVKRWTYEEKIKHLQYMKDTIKSSWEFIDYVFRIGGVTRAFTHQLVRTRTGSYAQQAMRVVDARDQPVAIPPKIEADEKMTAIWDEANAAIIEGYGAMLDAGAAPQDARGILPTNITTNIAAKFNLRTMHDLASLRLCTRTQGEYQDVFRLMREEVLKVHPWAEDFMQVFCVANGTCAFPRYGVTDCPVYIPEMDNSAVKAAAKEKFWGTRHESAPIAKGGMSQEGKQK